MKDRRISKIDEVKEMFKNKLRDPRDIQDKRRGGQMKRLHCCTCLSCCSDGQTLKSERQHRRKEYFPIIHSHKLICATSSCHGQEKCSSDK
ncbi:hypothetical protein CgunFtcFv8_010486 [Champsocephalus gunnari]|uniref:Uncharacterized protein n=1 Tax=Champsocephalus gunnari TaxID=52237 RepID=A0AAN8DV07_CHAGU|nr:hypothetical protein CgunFtcFv8_010486 [Champsocephalus gunnari]